MALDAYVGTMGAGKSHEVCKEVILVHTAKKRGVVVIGMKLDVEAISRRVGFDATRVVENGGSRGVACFDASAVKLPHFFPSEAEVVAGDTSHCCVQPGDLVVWDECWRDLGDGEDLAPEHMEFIRMHRHFAHRETRQTCDIVVLIQDMSSLNRKVRNVVESVWHLRKLRSLGLNKAYVLNRYEGKTVRPAALVSTWRRTYDKTIFPLYQSHAGGAAVEGNIDRRTIFWKDPKFIGLGVLAAALVVGGPFAANHYLWNMAGGQPKPVATPSPAASGPAGTGQPQSGTSQAAPIKSESKRPPIRIAGAIVDRTGTSWTVIETGDGIALMPSGAFQGTGVGSYGEYQGQRASTWGGSIPATVGGQRGGSGPLP